MDSFHMEWGLIIRYIRIYMEKGEKEGMWVVGKGSELTYFVNRQCRLLMQWGWIFERASVCFRTRVGCRTGGGLFRKGVVNWAAVC